MNAITSRPWYLAALLALLAVPATADAQNLRGAERARGAGSYEEIFNGRDTDHDEDWEDDDRDDRGRDDRWGHGRDDRDRDDRWDDNGRYDRRPGNGRVPPGWCRGRGNPHNTRDNCGYGARNAADDRRYEDRYGGVRGYDRDHDDFHRRLDQQYLERARSRPRDIAYQLQLRRQMNEEHERWHRDQGIAHR